jgi:hypothetical protein
VASASATARSSTSGPVTSARSRSVRIGDVTRRPCRTRTSAVARVPRWPWIPVRRTEVPGTSTCTAPPITETSRHTTAADQWLKTALGPHASRAAASAPRGPRSGLPTAYTPLWTRWSAPFRRRWAMALSV